MINRVKSNVDRQIFKRLLSALVLILSLSALGYGQKMAIEGLITDSSGNPVIGSSVQLLSGTDSVTTATDTSGNFRILAELNTDFRLTVTAMGFEPFSLHYPVNASVNIIQVPPIQLKAAFNALDAVVATAIGPVKVMEDTVQFDTRAYPVRPGDAVEEIVKKLPGVELDKNGNMTTEGEPITRIRLNGKDFFGEDAAAALQNLPADIVKNLQIIDDYGELNRITGIKSGEPKKVLNINTKPDKENGYFVKGKVGIGSHDRYTAGIRGNNFTSDRKLSFDGALNNTGSGDGIRTNRFAKVNYRANWGEKILSYGSYNFNSSKNYLEEKIIRQDFYKEYTRFDDEQRKAESNNNTLRFEWNLEYQAEKNNNLRIKPNLNNNSSRSLSAGQTNSRLLAVSSLRDYQTINDNSASGIGSEIFYNHKFKKPRRNITLESNLSYNGDDQLRDVSNAFTITDSLQNQTEEIQRQFWDSRNRRTTMGAEISYFEPVSPRSFIELEYEWDRSENRSIRDVTGDKADDSTSTALNNNYTYQFTTHRAGLNFQHRREKFNYVLGITAQPAILTGQDLSRNIATSKQTFNLIPLARFSYNFDKQRSFQASFNGRSNQPGFIQLQPITDNSNLQNTIVGNPHLKPELVSRLHLQYKQSGRGSGYDIFTSMNFSQTQNKIVNSRIVMAETLKQQTSFINADGFYSASGDYSITRRFSERKYSVNYYGGSNYNRSIAFNNNERNIGNTVILRQGLKLGIDIEDIIDARIHTAYSVNNTSYSLQSFNERKSNRLFLGLEGRNYLFDHWEIGYDFSKTINRGFNTAAIDPVILNLYLEYQFMRNNKARIRIQGFDLLNQNTGISRDVFDNQIIDRQTNRLGRYFMLSFDFRLNKFGGGS